MKTNKQTKEKEREKERERKRGKKTERKNIYLFFAEKYLYTFIPLYRVSKIPKPFSFYSVAMKYAKTLE